MEGGAVEQADAADEAGASDGASPLICVLGVPSSGQRPFSVAVTSPFAVQAGRSPLGGK
jgi:hypothetical protein